MSSGGRHRLLENFHRETWRTWLKTLPGDRRPWRVVVGQGCREWRCRREEKRQSGCLSEEDACARRAGRVRCFQEMRHWR